MTISSIDEHSFVPDLLPPVASILDCGCRGLNFARHFRALGHKVTAIDIDHLPEENEYMRVGISSINGKAYISNDRDEQARKCIGGKPFNLAQRADILANNETYIVTLETLEREFNSGQKFDLIKLDVEGAEMEILGPCFGIPSSQKHPLAKQISVEFHAHTGQTKDHLDQLLKYLSSWYEIHNRVWEKRHGCSENYWDILLIAK